MIIDCHCHAGKGDGLTGPWDTNAPLRDFLRWSGAAGQIETGRPITKKVDRMIAKEREAAREALVDGVELVDWSQVR